MLKFAGVVDAADELSLDEQKSLLEILRRRIAERNRAQLVKDVTDARDEFARGGAPPASAAEIMAEALALFALDCRVATGQEAPAARDEDTQRRAEERAAKTEALANALIEEWKQLLVRSKARWWDALVDVLRPDRGRLETGEWKKIRLGDSARSGY